MGSGQAPNEHVARGQLYTGWPIHRTGWLSLRHRSADMNTLITIGSTAAFGYGVFVTLFPGLLPSDLRDVYFEAVGVILTLILLGRLLEVQAKAGTGEAIRKLIGLQAKTARVIRHRAEQEVRVEEVVPGDIVVVRPGEKVPPMIAAAAMAASSLSVVSNANRLRGWKPPARPGHKTTGRVKAAARLSRARALGR